MKNSLFGCDDGITRKRIVTEQRAESRLATVWQADEVELLLIADKVSLEMASSSSLFSVRFG